MQPILHYILPQEGNLFMHMNYIEPYKTTDHRNEPECLLRNNKADHHGSWEAWSGVSVSTEQLNAVKYISMIQ